MEPLETPQDPFNLKYFLVIIAVLVAVPLLHVISGWFVFYL